MQRSPSTTKPLGNGRYIMNSIMNVSRSFLGLDVDEEASKRLAEHLSQLKEIFISNGIKDKVLSFNVERYKISGPSSNQIPKHFIKLVNKTHYEQLEVAINHLESAETSLGDKNNRTIKLRDYFDSAYHLYNGVVNVDSIFDIWVASNPEIPRDEMSTWNTFIGRFLIKVDAFGKLFLENIHKLGDGTDSASNGASPNEIVRAGGQYENAVTAEGLYAWKWKVGDILANILKVLNEKQGLLKDSEPAEVNTTGRFLRNFD
ncbi:hypothetical protein H4219_004069 [Mycoemilia scoparia]|uniref:Uncharacterized protein n=1 Tax=Mycoemilia scoparia TaxID=417184 RepID=A0A9W8A0Y5_9FUNG|nr:hypothetical protein H4219_004069 [Mycoemilia scoparia]